MKKLILFLVLLSSSVLAQTSSIGLNMPLLIDNQYEVSYQHQIHKRAKFIAIVGGSPTTRGIFNDKGVNYLLSKYENLGGDFQAKSQKTMGAYIKLGTNLTINIPDFSEATTLEHSNLKFYIGPAFCFSHFQQSGTIEKTTYSNNSQSTTINKAISEKGNLFSSGFTTGFTIGGNKDFSADLGMEYMGFERESEFGFNTNTLGVGMSAIVRLNYNFNKK